MRIEFARAILSPRPSEFLENLFGNKFPESPGRLLDTIIIIIINIIIIKKGWQCKAGR